MTSGLRLRALTTDKSFSGSPLSRGRTECVAVAPRFRGDERRVEQTPANNLRSFTRQRESRGKILGNCWSGPRWSLPSQSGGGHERSLLAHRHVPDVAGVFAHGAVGGEPAHARGVQNR